MYRSALKFQGHTTRIMTFMFYLFNLNQNENISNKVIVTIFKIQLFKVSINEYKLLTKVNESDTYIKPY